MKTTIILLILLVVGCATNQTIIIDNDKAFQEGLRIGSECAGEVYIEKIKDVLDGKELSNTKTRDILLDCLKRNGVEVHK